LQLLFYVLHFFLYAKHIEIHKNRYLLANFLCGNRSERCPADDTPENLFDRAAVTKNLNVFQHFDSILRLKQTFLAQETIFRGGGLC